jgi:hypothetical protein
MAARRPHSNAGFQAVDSFDRYLKFRPLPPMRDPDTKKPGCESRAVHFKEQAWSQ